MQSLTEYHIRFDEITESDVGIVLEVLPMNLKEDETEEPSEADNIIAMDSKENETETSPGDENILAMDIKETEMIAEENEDDDDGPMFVESRQGKKIIQYNKHRYRKMYKCKAGTRWNCSSNKHCGAYLYINDNNEITIINDVHEHEPPARVDQADADQSETAMVITSRKGKEMLLFRQYTYRRQYNKGTRSRWVCSTLKNCRGYVFTDENNYITSAFEHHNHDPPKYYLKPGHILGAIREPLILETD